MKQIPVEQLMAEGQLLPWTQDKHGNLKDAAGQRIRMNGVALPTGYVSAVDASYANEKIVQHCTNHFRELLDASKPFIQGTACLTPEHFDRLRSAVAAASTVEMEG